MMDYASIGSGTSSIGVSRTSKGDYSTEIKLYFVGNDMKTLHTMIARINKARIELENLLGIPTPQSEPTAEEIEESIIVKRIQGILDKADSTFIGADEVLRRLTETFPENIDAKLKNAHAEVVSAVQGILRERLAVVDAVAQEQKEAAERDALRKQAHAAVKEAGKTTAHAEQKAERLREQKKQAKQLRRDAGLDKKLDKPPDPAK